eukprot:CAMPEP_0203756572 /NCGR_PEP_ID=MMETSP0098-20131031/9833_1 /ASSEMBLY_ACC=CAM_ASM_000208 /TAXON_ID=96639 /ORGANISM=" , Strain NY0313808BC1" /LENGTH=367 /DNA_ID=CAMNT_0050648503 /DNA_START=60 /DNA_END=1163 /DNA_ORIENTATION=+
MMHQEESSLCDMYRTCVLCDVSLRDTTHDVGIEGGCAAQQRREELFHSKVDKLFQQEYGLGEFGKVIMKRWLKKMADEPKGLERVRDWILSSVNGKKDVRKFSKWQRECPDLIPGLRSHQFWTNDDLAGLIQNIESRFPRVLEEFEKQSKSEKVFQRYLAPNWVNPKNLAKDGVGSLATSSGDWDVCYLKLHNVDFGENCVLFPVCMELLASLGSRSYCHAFFSVLSPNTHITKHHGPTNKKLRIHLPLIVPPGESSGIRVGSETRFFEAGKCLVFDDSFEHEAFNNHPTQGRVCLIMDYWHPDFSDREISILKFLEKGKLKLAKKVCDNQREEGKDSAGSNFYSLLDHTRKLRKCIPLRDDNTISG